MRYLLTSLFMLTGATTATAQGFAGASIDVTHLRFPDIKEIEATDFSASVDFDVASGFGLGASITSRDQATDAGSADVTGLTLHGIYTVDSATKVGFFIAREDVSRTDNDLETLTFGIQSAFTVGPITGDAHLGRGEVESTANDQTNDLTYYGASGAYGFGNGFYATGAGFFGRVEDRFSTLDVTTVELGAKFALTRNFDIAATVGKVKAEVGSGDTQEETFIGLSASFAFGPQGAATFGSRGIYQVLKVGF